MLTALISLPIYIGLSAALTVVVADLLSPEKKAKKAAARAPEKRAEKHAAA